MQIALCPTFVPHSEFKKTVDNSAMDKFVFLPMNFQTAKKLIAEGFVIEKIVYEQGCGMEKYLA